MLWLLDQLRAAQGEIATLKNLLVKEIAATELESALQARASSEATTACDCVECAVRCACQHRRDEHIGGLDACDVESCGCAQFAEATPPVATTGPTRHVEMVERIVDGERRMVPADPVATTGPDERTPIIAELRRVVAASLAHDKGGQQVGPMFPGRMPPSIAKHFQKLLDAQPSSPSHARTPDVDSAQVRVQCRKCAAFAFVREGYSLDPIYGWCFDTDNEWRCPACSD
jgi:hypothetical protein